MNVQAKPQYRLGRIEAPTETLDPETRRHVRHHPRPELALFVGKSSRVVRVPLTEMELLRIARECIEAATKVRAANQGES